MMARTRLGLETLMLRNTYIQTTFLFYEESLYEECSLDRVEVLLKEVKVMTN